MNHKTLLSLTAALIISTSSVLASGNGDEKDTQHGKLAHNPFNGLSVNSYKYNTAVGIRGLGTSGLTIKHFTRSDRAIEGIWIVSGCTVIHPSIRKLRECFRPARSQLVLWFRWSPGYYH